jgi:hypothetical protein
MLATINGRVHFRLTLPHVAQNCLREVCLPLELYLRLCAEADTFETLRLLCLEAQHDFNDIQRRADLVAYNHSRKGSKKRAAAAAAL